MSNIIYYKFPMLGSEFLYYQEEHSYRFKVENVDNEIGAEDESIRKYSFRHSIKGTNIVTQLIRENKARFACMVSLPNTLYRQTFITEEVNVLNEDNITCAQVISLPKSFGIKDPPRILPIIIYYGDQVHKVDIETLGSSSGLELSSWPHGECILRKGDIIAKEPWQYLTEVKPMIFKADENLPEGVIGNIDIERSDGGKFIVELSPNLMELCRNSDNQVRSINTHILSKCLRTLHDTYGNREEIAECLNFQYILEEIAKRDGELDFDESEFDADKAACLFMPHLNRDNEQEDD